MKYRKKPVVVEAIQWQSGIGYEQMSQFLRGVDALFCNPQDKCGTIKLPTLEGTMTVSNGDWVIKGVKGEFCPCKPDVFAATYERVLEE